MQLDTLPDDIILTVLMCLLDTAIWRPTTTVSKLESVFFPESRLLKTATHPLAPLSLTCSRIRAACIPILFKHIILTDQYDLEEVPAVLAHARFLHLCHSATVAGINAVLKAGPRICEAYCQSIEQTAIPAILSCPTLEGITLHDVSLTSDVPLPCVAAPLRSLRMVFTSPRLPGTARFGRSPWPDKFPRERDLLESIISHCHSTLEVLVLPGASTRLSALASSVWPRLGEFALCGLCPDLDTSFASVLAAMPKLRVLTLALSQRRLDPAPLAILPAEIGDHISLDLGGLVRVTLSYPHPDDSIFRLLTPALRELSLRDSPRYYYKAEHSNSFYRTPILSCRAALRIFGRLGDACCNLRRLELVVRARETDLFDDEVELYAFVAAACPRLRVLELHRYRDALPVDPWDASVTVEVPLDALQGFRSLKQLRLNLDLPPDRYTPESYLSSLETLDGQASRIAQALPWLETVVLFHCNFAERYAWQPWDVLPGGGVVRAPEPFLIESSDMEWL